MRVGDKPLQKVAVSQTDEARAAPSAEQTKASTVTLPDVQKAALSGFVKAGVQSLGSSPLGTRLGGFNPFLRNVHEDDAKTQGRIRGEGGAHILLRKSPEVFAERAREKLADLLDLDAAESVLLHGDAHIEQYIQNGSRFGLSDLDNLRTGAWAEDLVRLWSSALIKTAGLSPGTEASLQQSLREGYLLGLSEKDAPAEPPSLFESPEALDSARTYLDGDEFLARLMRDNPIDKGDPRLGNLVAQYAATCDAGLPPEAFKIVEAGMTTESGVASRGTEKFLVVLEGKGLGRDDDLFVEFKPQDRPGIETVEANRVYGTPEGLMGHAQLDGVHYWVHELDAAYQELEDLPTAEKAAAAVFAIARQLGTAHARTAKNVESLRAQAAEGIDEVCIAGRVLTDEIESARAAYLAQLG